MCFCLQGYVVYSVKNKLKPQYLGLPGEKIKDLKVSGVQVSKILALKCNEDGLSPMFGISV